MKNQRIIFLKGLPASGKSTRARYMVTEGKGDYVRVNKDDLRLMLFDKHWSSSREKLVVKVRDQIVREILESGRTPIVDDTNYAPKHYNTIKAIANAYGVEVVVVEMETSIAECIERNRNRPISERVPEHVIWDMYEKYILPRKQQELIFAKLLPKAIMVDVDGTLALHEERSPFNYHECLDDTLNEPIAELVREYALTHRVLIVTGRENMKYGDKEFSSVLEFTKEWLDRNGVPYDAVFIREEGDHRKDYLVKKELWDRYIKGQYNVKFVLDDRKQVIDMWREEGLTVLDVAGHTF